MKSIRYHGEAREEFLGQVRYYSGISARLGERFDKAILSAEALVAEFQNIGSPY